MACAYEVSRRELIGRGLAFAGAAAASSSIPGLLGANDALAAGDDKVVLESAISLEQSAVLAYEAAGDTGKLGRATGLAKLFARQEQRHADALVQALQTMGGTPPAKPTRAGEVTGLPTALRGNATVLLTFAVELETMALAAYYGALAKLRSPELLSTATSIMANEAQHLAILRQELHTNPSPEAFVTGGKQVP